MKLLIGTFFFSFGSALIPILNAEAYVAVAANTYPAILIASVAAVGQMVGKTLWYYAGANAEKLPWIHARMDKPKSRASMEKWQERTQGRPWFTAALLFASAWAGIPPYAVMAALAGVLRVNFLVFLLTGLVGRFLRFWIVAAAATSLFDLLR
ncbi:VTT domain-containing protein [Nocardioides sp. InS609-2]|uniref:VTT domain-containing protein n=1 Tax=Nocardioides sp. InS609-2 TaxID=2760705 RepID=UPI0017C0D4EC|nr:VTT domain-containing protein [Nocardioides sp. InS609-2]MBA3780664.1 VTT domain-containing protein [Nocardioides sp.]